MLFIDVIKVFLVVFVQPMLTFVMLLVNMLHVIDVILKLFAIMVVEFLKIFIGEWAPVRRGPHDNDNGGSEYKNNTQLIIHRSSQRLSGQKHQRI